MTLTNTFYIPKNAVEDFCLKIYIHNKSKFKIEIDFRLKLIVIYPERYKFKM